MITQKSLFYETGGAPDYSSIISVSSTSYTCPSNGYFLFGPQNTSKVAGTISVNGVAVLSWYVDFSYGQTAVPVKSGDKVTVTAYTSWNKFVPCD